MKKLSIVIITFLGSVSFNKGECQNWGLDNSRTEWRDNAGAQGDAGAQSGFFQTVNPTNYPVAAGGWWHLLDIRHSNPANDYAMQFAGAFFDQYLYFRKTNGNPSQSWSKVLLQTDGKASITNPGVFPGSSSGLILDGSGMDGTNNASNVVLKATSNMSLGGFLETHIGNWQGYYNWTVGSPTGNRELMRLTAVYGGDPQFALLGVISSKKVKVTQSGWPDYVFDKEYRLPTLEEIEKYINLNKHLPDVPSACEIEKNGIDLGENQTLLLRKIEELTLIVIDLNKKVEQLSKKAIEYDK